MVTSGHADHGMLYVLLICFTHVVVIGNAPGIFCSVNDDVHANRVVAI